MKKKMEPFTGWTIVSTADNGKQYTLDGAVMRTRKEALDLFNKKYGLEHTWEQLKADGFAAIKVKIEARGE